MTPEINVNGEIPKSHTPTTGPGDYLIFPLRKINFYSKLFTEMAQNSKIEWTQCTWNPVTGCTKISTGCKNCYAQRMALRLKAMGQPNYRNGFRVTKHPHALKTPLRWKQPRTIFVNSMSDLFHQAVDLDFISSVFEVMHRARQHRFQVLTKRSARLLQLSYKLNWQTDPGRRQIPVSGAIVRTYARP
jgi:DNA repair photolyase